MLRVAVGTCAKLRTQEEKSGINEMWQKFRELEKEVRQLKEESAKKDQVLVALLRRHHLATQVCSRGP